MSDLSALESMPHCWIGPPGQLVPAGYGGDLSHSMSRPSSVKTTLGGRDKVQWGSMPSREWSVKVNPWEGDYYHGLEALVWGAYGPPPWAFITPHMATTNLVTPKASLFSQSPLTTSGGVTLLGAFQGLDGTRHPVSLNAPSGNVYFAVRTPVVPGPVTGSVYATAGTRFHLHVRDVTGAVLENVNTTAKADGERVSLTVDAPPGAAYVWLAVAASAGPGVVAGPSVTLTDKPLPYSWGQGVDAVFVDKLDTSPMLMNQHTGTMSSYSYTVQEIRK